MRQKDYLNSSKIFAKCRINSVISSIVSGTVATLLDNPFDLIRTRQQCLDNKQDNKKKNLLKVMKDIYKYET